jgi:hypothetical protein
MLCFPSEEEMGDLTNRGDPFVSICNLFLLGNESSIATKLQHAGYEVSEASVAQIWVRADGPKTSCDNNVGDTGFNSHAPSSELSRVHLPSDVKARMKQLCSEICPRNTDGVMLGERAPAGGTKRPAWCTAHILKVLHTEFEASKLNGAELKIDKHIARSVLTMKRLKNMSEEAWQRMSEADRLKQRSLLEEFEYEAENWRRGPYGSLWNYGNLRMQPTNTKIDEYHQRQVKKASKPDKPKR